MESKTPEQLAEERYPTIPMRSTDRPYFYEYECREKEQEAYAACYREHLLAGKEGPSVEDIMEVVKGSNAWDTLLESPHRIVEMDYYEMDIRTRLSARFTQTQAEPEMPSDFEIDTEADKQATLFYKNSTGTAVEIGQREYSFLLGFSKGGRWVRERVSDVQGATKERSHSEATEAKRTPERSAADEGSGTPKNNVEQSEDAALPDGRWNENDERMLKDLMMIVNQNVFAGEESMRSSLKAYMMGDPNQPR